MSGVRCHNGTGVCDSESYVDVYLNAVMNRQKVELIGDWPYFRRCYRLNLAPGDYTARLVKTGDKSTVAPLYDEYELLLPDRRVWRCTVTGVFE